MTRAHLMTYFLSNLATVVILSICGCASGPIPKWDGKLWAGKSKFDGIMFTGPDGTNQVIKATDPAFDDYIAMSGPDFVKFMSTYVYGCKQWPAGTAMMSSAAAMERFHLVIEAWKAEGTPAP